MQKAANSTNMWIFTNGLNLGASRLIGEAVYKEMKETQAFRSNCVQNTALNIVGIMREDHLRYGEQIEGVLQSTFLFSIYY